MTRASRRLFFTLFAGVAVAACAAPSDDAESSETSEAAYGRRKPSTYAPYFIGETTVTYLAIGRVALHVVGDSTADGALVEAVGPWPWGVAQPAPTKWRVFAWATGDGDGRAYKFVSVDSGKCLQIEGAPGAEQLVQRTCTSPSGAQTFYYHGTYPRAPWLSPATHDRCFELVDALDRPTDGRFETPAPHRFRLATGTCQHPFNILAGNIQNAYAGGAVLDATDTGVILSAFLPHTRTRLTGPAM